MMFKRFMCLSICFLLLFPIGISAFAAVPDNSTVEPLYNYSTSASATLTISNGTATCKSIFKGIPGVTTKVKITMILEKKTNGEWNPYKTWTATINDTNGTLTKTTAVSSGTYRVHSVFTAYSGTKSEKLTRYSPIV